MTPADRHKHVWDCLESLEFKDCVRIHGYGCITTLTCTEALEAHSSTFSNSRSRPCVRIVDVLYFAQMPLETVLVTHLARLRSARTNPQESLGAILSMLLFQTWRIQETKITRKSRKGFLVD